MPFITEETWQNLLHRLPRVGDLPDSVMVAPYPASEPDRIDHRAEQEMQAIILMVRAIRNARAQLRIPSGQRLEAIVDADPSTSLRSGGLKEAVEEEAPAICALARVEPLRILDGSRDRPSAGQAITLVVEPSPSSGQAPLVVTLPLSGVVDIYAERARLGKELEDCTASLERVQGLLSNANFSSRAPEEVVEREQERLKSLQERQERLKETLAQLPS